MIVFSNLTFTYPGANRPALQDVSLRIPSGALCLVMGASGSGKSTLLRCINGLVPHFTGGNLSGNIRLDDLDPVKLSPREMSRVVGFVFQDPEAQFVVDRVEDEIAFSLENIALPRDEMERRVQDSLALLELTHLRSRKLDTLSGGEMQRVAIAAALALKPHVLILDEPTSQLDPQGAEEVLQALVRLRYELNITIVLAEHRLERVLPHANQIIYLAPDQPGCLSGEPRQVLERTPLAPPMVQLGKVLGWQPLPLTISEARNFVEHTGSSPVAIPRKSSPGTSEQMTHGKPPFIKAKSVQVSFGSLPVLCDIDLSLYPGEITVLMGPNGAGKTTLLRSLVGLKTIDSGSIQVGGLDITGRSVADICQQVGYLPQDPNALLFADKVMDELLITLRNHQLGPRGLQIQPGQLLEQLGLSDKADSYPRDLSTGERQRVALGSILVTHPGALLLDEPTRGLDYVAKQKLLDLLHAWRDEGMAVLMVTHDVELAAQAADRVMLMERGQVTADGSPKEIFSHSATFAPQVAKIYPGQGWLTVKDVLGETYAS